jgi:hypothetical protein
VVRRGSGGVASTACGRRGQRGGAVEVGGGEEVEVRGEPLEEGEAEEEAAIEGVEQEEEDIKGVARCPYCTIGLQTGSTIHKYKLITPHDAAGFQNTNVNSYIDSN